MGSEGECSKCRPPARGSARTGEGWMQEQAPRKKRRHVDMPLKSIVSGVRQAPRNSDAASSSATRLCYVSCGDATLPMASVLARRSMATLFLLFSAEDLAFGPRRFCLSTVAIRLVRMSGVGPFISFDIKI